MEANCKIILEICHGVMMDIEFHGSSYKIMSYIPSNL